MFNFKPKSSPRDRINRWQGYAIVYQTIHPDRPGRVQFNAISWRAQSATGELIPIDARVEVIGHAGINLVVRRC
jgi:membrane protein implicated in regulation of membrane protease activity